MRPQPRSVQQGDPPDHHPAMVAAEGAQFDHVTEGRFIMGICPGGLAPRWEPFGNADATPRLRQHAAAAERAAAAGRPGATPAVTGAAISV